MADFPILDDKLESRPQANIFSSNVSNRLMKMEMSIDKLQ